MYFMALATDYDGTIARDGLVSQPTVEALQRLKQHGLRLVMITGRELPDLERIFPHLEIFDRIVAENGALLFTPGSRELRPLGPAPPHAFVERLGDKKIEPLSIGRVIVATWEPNETAVLETIRELGLDLQIIFNKGAVMILPSGINKATGLQAALDDLGLSSHNVIAIGDAENDLAFMRCCGCAVAVANALPAVKDEADLVTAGQRGLGVMELIERILSAEPSLLDAAIHRHTLALGTDQAGTDVRLRPGAGNLLIAGTSGGGKSTFANALLERMVEQSFQFCIFDPEGDYADLEHAVVFGDPKTMVRSEPVLVALEKPGTNVVVNMLGVDIADRPGLFGRLYTEILGHHVNTARPHWILIDEAHHMVPRHRDSSGVNLSADEPPTIFVTVHPESLAQDVLESLGMIACIGDSAGDVLCSIADALGRPCPPLPNRSPEQGEMLYWACRSDEQPRLLKMVPPRQAQRRHTRKYAEGALGEDKSFYFRGADGALNLRAQNLMVFLQMADGVDEGTFMHHLTGGDYSRWFRSSIKDDDLAAEVESIERRPGIAASEARARLRQVIEQRYTAPAVAIT